jgi:hypothetical protein
LTKAAAALEVAKGQGDSRKTKELQAQLAGEQLKLTNAKEKTTTAALMAEREVLPSRNELAAQFKDVLAEHLDAEQGSSITDKTIYRCAHPHWWFVTL